MQTITDRPPISQLVLFSVLGSVLIALSWGFNTGSNEINTFTAAVAGAGAAGFFFVAYALWMTAWYISQVITDIQERRAEIQSITPRLRELEAIRSLTPDQLAVVPRMDHTANIKQYLSKSNGGWSVVECLSTPGGDVPIEFIRQFLKYGGVRYLHPINTYSEGTLNYIHARAFTDWLRQQGLAVGGEGKRAGQAAQWVSDECRQEAYSLFNVTIETDQYLMHDYEKGKGDE